uniref:DNA mismatch repair protein mutL n=1 Tax=Anthurium amnicola TaxID=1678845 RepID=A0A1D1ZGS7_9ARAE
MASFRATLSRFPFRSLRIPCRTPGSDPKVRSFSAFQAAQQEASLFRRQISLAGLLQRYGFPSSDLTRFLQSNRFLLDSDRSDVQRCMGVLLSLGLSQDSLVSVISSCPRVLELGFLRKWQLGFSHLGFSSVPPLLVQRILEQSLRCRIEPEDVLRNLLALREAGLCDKTVIRVLEELPATRIAVPEINHRVGLLTGIGLSKDEVDRVIYSFPGFVAMSLEGRLRPLFEEFEELGLANDEVRKAVLEHPRVVLTMEAGELSRCVELLRSLKCRLPIKDKILCEGAIRAAIRVKLRVDRLCGHGLIRRDSLKVLWKEPRSILYELDDIDKKIEFLVDKMGFGVDWLVEVPEYLGVNLEKQVVPRYNVIEHLRTKGALGFQVDLKHMIRPSRMKFYNMFVKPYPECERIFGGMVRDVKVKPRHPVGLWTLFKPQTYPQSKDDTHNMKLFMESLV